MKVFFESGKCVSRLGRSGGFILPSVLIVSMLLFVLAGAAFLTAGMNLRLLAFFEQQSVLERATVSFAESLARQVLLGSADAAWNGPDPVRGTLSLGPGQGVEGVSPMKMTYTVTRARPGRWQLNVTGEYPTPGSNGLKANATTWGVSIDVVPARSVPVETEAPVRLH